MLVVMLGLALGCKQDTSQEFSVEPEELLSPSAIRIGPSAWGEEVDGLRCRIVLAAYEPEPIEYGKKQYYFFRITLEVENSAGRERYIELIPPAELALDVSPHTLIKDQRSEWQIEDLTNLDGLPALIKIGAGDKAEFTYEVGYQADYLPSIVQMKASVGYPWQELSSGTVWGGMMESGVCTLEIPERTQER
ncbi:MAG: hypothetical protein AAGA29_11995 [Planctomycetota bacterium]